ncbi:hypothetical protein [Agrococcus sp. SGAir0287]|uniref:hypothetical protein n=1 Tax=Agrococcus sp. SGAir0287 TaxID=2070347 RepID=UPI0010F885B5|nr:hypothetical protein [Agrococcus sp. SGAir0287]
MTNAPFLTMIVGSDADARRRLAAPLAHDPSLRVLEVDDVDALVALAAANAPHVVLGDASLVADREVVRAVRRVAAHVGIVVQTHDAMLEDAVLALRARVDEFFPTSLEPTRLAEVVLGLAEHAQRRRDLAAPSALETPREVSAPAAGADADA